MGRELGDSESFACQIRAGNYVVLETQKFLHSNSFDAIRLRNCFKTNNFLLSSPNLLFISNVSPQPVLFYQRDKARAINHVAIKNLAF